ncbi:unannotated protein [freshwater metagenome]
MRYTSGCPKIQNKCSHNSGLAPFATLKKFASNSRSSMSRTWADVSTGIAKSSKNCDTSAIQVKIGIRMSVMPGARILSTVTMRFTAPVSEAIPVMIKPRFQKSTPWVGEKMTPLFGAYMNQPPSAPPPSNQLELRKTPPAKNAQKLNALIRGNATSRAPICSGIR